MSAGGDRTKVLIADDQALVRRGFRMILEIEPDLEVVGEAADGEEAVTGARDLAADIVLMDVRMPGVDGIEATRRLTSDTDCPAKIIMLTTFDMDDYVYDALEAGASGFLLKDVEPEMLVAGIHAVQAGESLLAPTVTRRMITTFLARRPTPDHADDVRLQSLTQRERQTLELIARGLTNTEIAETFVISETTVKTHVSRILTKLEVRDRVHAVIYAFEHGLTNS